MPLTKNEQLHSPLFDRAMELRDSGHLEESSELLEQLLHELGPEDKSLVAHAQSQMGYIRKMQGRLVDSERHFREAMMIAPKMELASLGLFHALSNLGRHVEAMGEVVRFLSLRESLAYRELLSGGAFSADVADEERRLADVARSLLAKHREAQQARSELMKGDTVRVRSHAEEAARPGSLASVRGQRTAEGTTLFQIAFSDGEPMDVPGSLLDHTDI
ncbi:MAG: hypothetical protein NT062_08400 [Proteobacteria bacterium]|nr:hypothetical protein [Pseudomonadota bacterium]